MITDAKYVAERDRRVALLDKLIEDTRVDALVLTSTAQQAYQIATKYVSGYQLTTRRDFVFMKPGEMPRLIIPTVGQQFHARRLSWLPDENIYCGPMAGNGVWLDPRVGADEAPSGNVCDRRAAGADPAGNIGCRC